MKKITGNMVFDKKKNCLLGIDYVKLMKFHSSKFCTFFSENFPFFRVVVVVKIPDNYCVFCLFFFKETREFIFVEKNFI